MEAAAKKGLFREDLYFRLGGAIVAIPPLRERSRDIMALARRFLGDLGGGGRLALGPAAERTLILEALEACAGNQTRAAERLGISRRTMVSRLAELGIGRKRGPMTRAALTATSRG
ncbi:MAG: hypothetical protein HYY06_21510 [Deltaproteobacteria bacterium]|nr:hypothetical protein [Deltaproteobacteria bacterium]